MTGNRIWIFVAIVAIVAIVALGWILGVSPKLAEADVAVAQQQDVDAQNATQEAALVTLRKQFTNLKTIKAELTDLQTEIPSAPGLEAFLDALKALAETTGVTLVNIAVEEATSYGGAAVDGVAPAPAPAPAPDGVVVDGVPPAPDGANQSTLGPQPDANLAAQLFTVGVSIKVEGLGSQVIEFARAVQEGKRLFLGNVVSFTSDDGGTVSGYLFVVRSPRGTAPATG